MVGPSKILTVSYGTFSCTLEGFDNPFSTMRGIAEYFRDLAADDRYFGAEPPIPDAEMLHRIAEADAHKRVVAHVENNGVTLRQVEDADTAELAPVPSVAAVPEAQFSDPFVDEPADIVALNEPSEVQAESVAAKLARIRAVVSHKNVATDIDERSEDAVFSNAPISAAFEDTNAGFDDTLEIAEVSPVPDPEPVQDNIEPMAYVAAAAEELPDPVLEIAPVAETEPFQEAVFDPGEAAEPVLEDQTDTGDDVASDAMEATAENDAQQEADPKLEPVDSQTIAQFMGEPDSDEEAVETDDAEATYDPDAFAISQVVKMRRSEFDAATETAESDVDDQAELGQAPEVDIEHNDGSSLSADDEAELMANLAEVQRKAEVEERSEKEGRALLENKDIESSGESVSRILEVTNSEMEETEGTRRRTAIAHLKAAVAATRADKFLTSKRKKNEVEEINQYRDDLAKVVKPRRAAPEAGKSARQAPLMLVSEQRIDVSVPTAPLDGPAVLPRRIEAEQTALSDHDKENLFLENNTFAEFAAEMGASELPDLLEAAAAYSAYIQGQAHFTRPQIMQAVAGIREEEFSREEGLRSFGLLLRRGKIKKLQRGQFTIADTTRFHPQPRAVGQ